MRSTRIAILGLLLASPLSPVLAQDASGDAPTAAPKLVKEKKVCRAEETTGSNIPSRVCHTAPQWKIIDGANQQNAERAQDLGRSQGAGVH